MKRILLGAACAGALAAVPAVAQTPSYVNGMRMSLGYDGRLIVKVLDIQLDQTVRNGAYNSNIRMVSSGVLRVFKKIDQRASASGRVESDGDVRPGSFQHQNVDGEKNRRVRVTWTGGDVVTNANPEYSNLGDPAATRAQRLEAADPLTQLMRMTLTANGSNPCQVGTRRFFDGKQRYDLHVSYVGRTQPNARERRLSLTDTIRCTVRYEEVAGFKRKPPEERNQGLNRPLTLGMARYGQGGPWVLSYIQAQTRLGNANIELQRAAISY